MTSFYNILRENPLAAIFTIAAVVLLLKNNKKLILHSGKALGVIFNLLANAVIALCMAIALVGTIFTAASGAGGVQFAFALQHFMNQHFIPWLIMCCVKYNVYIFPKLLIFIKSAVYKFKRFNAEKIKYGEAVYFEAEKIELRPISLILLQ